jgi:hypothetical protein
MRPFASSKSGPPWRRTKTPCYWWNPHRSAIVEPELSLGTVGAVDDHVFGFILFDDGQVCAPTARLFLRPRLLPALLAPQHGVHPPRHYPPSSRMPTPETLERGRARSPSREQTKTERTVADLLGSAAWSAIGGGLYGEVEQASPQKVGRRRCGSPFSECGRRSGVGWFAGREQPTVPIPVEGDDLPSHGVGDESVRDDCRL